jgi:transcription elongation factor GreA
VSSTAQGNSIVGEDEADIKAGRISISSPIATASIGKEAGDEGDVNTPGGVKKDEILNVRNE